MEEVVNRLVDDHVDLEKMQLDDPWLVIHNVVHLYLIVELIVIVYHDHVNDHLNDHFDFEYELHYFFFAYTEY